MNRATKFVVIQAMEKDNSGQFEKCYMPVPATWVEAGGWQVLANNDSSGQTSLTFGPDLVKYPAKATFSTEKLRKTANSTPLDDWTEMPCRILTGIPGVSTPQLVGI